MTISVTVDTSAAGEFGEQRLAQIGAPAAAVLRKEEHQRSESANLGTLDLLPALLLSPDQPRLGQNGEVRRECTLGKPTRLHECTGGQPVGLVRHEPAEGVKPSWMRQGS
jgi:hypothetical protein